MIKVKSYNSLVTDFIFTCDNCGMITEETQGVDPDKPVMLKGWKRNNRNIICLDCRLNALEEQNKTQGGDDEISR